MRTDAYTCRVCGAIYVVPSLARACEINHEPPTEEKP